jgi:hypothetical protein
MKINKEKEMKKVFVLFAVFSLLLFVLSCGEDETISDDNNNIEEDADDTGSEGDNKEDKDNTGNSDEVPDDVSETDKEVEDTDITDEPDIDEEDAFPDEEEIVDKDNEHQDDVDNGPDYSCNSQPCSVDEDCDCDASWCVIDDDNVSYAGLTKQTCAKADCVEGDDSTCPPDYTCVKIPGFVLALMPDLPHTVCKAK